MSSSYFKNWHFGFEKFMELSRNGPLVFSQFMLPTVPCWYGKRFFLNYETSGAPAFLVKLVMLTILVT